MGHWETSPEPAVQFEHFFEEGPEEKGQQRDEISLHAA